jgi:hypothetical protein
MVWASVCVTWIIWLAISVPVAAARCRLLVAERGDECANAARCACPQADTQGYRYSPLCSQTLTDGMVSEMYTI